MEHCGTVESNAPAGANRNQGESPPSPSAAVEDRGSGFLLPGERAEDLQYRNLKIIQSDRGYRFTSDAVLLAGIADAGANDNVVDLGTGSGVVATLLAARTGAHVCGVEIQAALADRAARTVKLNAMEDRIQIFNCDLRDAYKKLGANTFDVAVANPPYYPLDSCGGAHDFAKPDALSDEIKNAKFETLVTLIEVFRAAKRLLKYGGKFYVVSKAERLTDLLSGLRLEGLEPKTVMPVEPNPGAAIDTVIVKAVKGGKPPLTMPAPLILNDRFGEMTEQVKRLYHK